VSLHEGRIRRIFYWALLILTVFVAVALIQMRGTRPVLSSEMKSLMNASLQTSDSRGIASQAHAVGHHLAESDTQASLTTLFSQCGDPKYFLGACLHGVVMGMSDAHSTESIAKQCSKPQWPDQLYSRNCAHGLGHILYMADSLNTSIEKCGRYLSAYLQPDCTSGVFMEYMLGTHTVAMGGSAPKSVTLPNCSGYDQTIRHICAGAIGSYSLYDPNSTTQVTLSLCRQFADSTDIDYCLLAAADRLRLAPKVLDEYCLQLTYAETVLVDPCRPKRP
jgi:hypothetical protein